MARKTMDGATPTQDGWLRKTLPLRQRLVRFLERHGRYRALEALASAYVTGRRRQRCRVTSVEGLWVHEYRGGTLVGRGIGGLTPDDLVSRGTDLLDGELPPSGGTVFDVGAGVGEETWMLAHAVGPHGRVFAFEAHPETFRCLDQLCRRNALNNVTPLPLAIAGHAGHVEISDVESDRSLGNTLLVGSASSTGSTIQVPAVTLDEIVARHDVRRIDLLKMNIEGAERLAIEGMSETVRRTSRAIIECHDFKSVRPDDGFATRETVAAFLSHHGFDLRVRDDELRPWVRDTLYATRKRERRKDPTAALLPT